MILSVIILSCVFYALGWHSGYQKGYYASEKEYLTISLRKKGIL